jgi:prevent-host-death family protein
VVSPPRSPWALPHRIDGRVVAELKDRLSEFLKRVEEGDEISVCKRNIPIARIGPAPEGSGEPQSSKRRSLGDVKGWLEDDDGFFRAPDERQRDVPRDPFD